MNCIIVDDDELSRAALRKCVERSDFLNLVAECKDAVEAQKVIHDNQIDLMFLDVEMPEMSGIEFIKNVEVACQVIIVSSKKEYAVDAFEYNVTDYLLKPVQFARYMKAVEKARQIYENVKS